MIPSIFDYLPNYATSLMQKVAEEGAPAQQPEVAPPHPYHVGMRQMLPIGLGTALGAAAGYGIPLALGHYGVLKRPSNAALIAATSLSGGIGGIAGMLMSQARDAEIAHATEEYQNHLARRAGAGRHPEVQPPEVHP